MFSIAKTIFFGVIKQKIDTSNEIMKIENYQKVQEDKEVEVIHIEENQNIDNKIGHIEVIRTKENQNIDKKTDITEVIRI